MGWKDNLEETFVTWSKPPSDSEETRCENAISMIKSAILAHPKLSTLNIVFIPQGSYHNNTNVKLNSDVDICVKLKDPFFTELPEGMRDEDFGLSTADYTFTEYKNDVEKALVEKFGQAGVTRGNKAFDVHSNTYRVDADVVACFEHRRYATDGSFITGTQFFSDSWEKIVNFPEQHYSNGVAKNNATNTYYKKAVRILKRLKMQMQDDSISGLDNISSFLIECLVWNVPNEFFTNETFTEDIKDILVFLYHATKDDAGCKEWGEVSEFLYLFHSGRPFNRNEVNTFILNAYSHLFS